MHDVTSHLMERVFPEVPIRQYVLSPPSELVGLLAAREDVLAARARGVVQSICRGPGARRGRAVHGGAVVFVQRFTKTLSVYPHLHVLALDGGYGEDDEGALEFHADPGPSPASRAAMEAEVETRLSGWLGRRGYLDEGSAPRPDDGWWLSGAGEPSGVSARGPRRVRSGFEVHTSVRVRADDRLGRAQLIRYVSRPPFAEAQVEVVDEEQVRFVLRSPSRSGQGELRLHPLALLRRLAWLDVPDGLAPVDALACVGAAILAARRSVFVLADPPLLICDADRFARGRERDRVDQLRAASVRLERTEPPEPFRVLTIRDRQARPVQNDEHAIVLCTRLQRRATQRGREILQPHGLVFSATPSQSRSTPSGMLVA
ncbi:MAG: transposase [Deltaproteobacteria bacterium]